MIDLVSNLNADTSGEVPIDDSLRSANYFEKNPTIGVPEGRYLINSEITFDGAKKLSFVSTSENQRPVFEVGPDITGSWLNFHSNVWFHGIDIDQSNNTSSGHISLKPFSKALFENVNVYGGQDISSTTRSLFNVSSPNKSGNIVFRNVSLEEIDLPQEIYEFDRGRSGFNIPRSNQSTIWFDNCYISNRASCGIDAQYSQGPIKVLDTHLINNIGPQIRFSQPSSRVERSTIQIDMERHTAPTNPLENVMSGIAISGDIGASSSGTIQDSKVEVLSGIDRYIIGGLVGGAGAAETTVRNSEFKNKVGNVPQIRFYPPSQVSQRENNGVEFGLTLVNCLLESTSRRGVELRVDDVSIDADNLRVKRDSDERIPYILPNNTDISGIKLI